MTLINHTAIRESTISVSLESLPDVSEAVEDRALEDLQTQLGVRFKEPDRLRRALTHRSMATQDPKDSNERLEFLGDSVVGLIMCEVLFRRFPEYSEGDLAKSKAYVVSEAALADAAQSMGLEQFVRMSAGEAASGGRRRRSILADAFEALIAAVYLDSGIVAARRIVRTALTPAVDAVAADQYRRDYKSSLQEQTQARVRQAPLYWTKAEEGQEHDRTFRSQARIDGVTLGVGQGKSKKEAEQAAAQDALAHLDTTLPVPTVTAEATEPGIEATTAGETSTESEPAPQLETTP